MNGDMWSYKGLDIYRADLNSSGIRWTARSPWGQLRADTKVSMRELINETLKANGLTRMGRRRR